MITELIRGAPHQNRARRLARSRPAGSRVVLNIRVRRPRILALSIALALAASLSLAVASPALADSGGQVKNSATGMCFAPDSPFQGATIVQVTCAPDGQRDTLQEWDFVCFDSSCRQFHVVNHGALLCLSTRGGARNGTALELWTCNQISNEKWDFGPSPSGAPFELRSRVSGTTTHCLDVPDGRNTINLWLQLYDCNGSTAQSWDQGPPIIE